MLYQLHCQVQIRTLQAALVHLYNNAMASVCGCHQTVLGNIELNGMKIFFPPKVALNENKLLFRSRMGYWNHTNHTLMFVHTRLYEILLQSIIVYLMMVSKSSQWNSVLSCCKLLMKILMLLITYRYW